MRRIKGFKNYLVGADGRIFNAKRKRFVKPVLRRYKQITLYNEGEKHSLLVHRLVADAWIDNCENKVVSHKNHNTYNNLIRNLEVVEQVDNIRRSVNDKRNAFGQKQHLSKLDEDKVIYIRESGKTSLELSEELNVSVGTIREVRRYVTWRHVK